MTQHVSRLLSFVPRPPAEHLDIILLAPQTQAEDRSPNAFIEDRREVPLLILVQDPHTGAIRCRAPGWLRRANIIASLNAVRKPQTTVASDNLVRLAWSTLEHYET